MTVMGGAPVSPLASISQPTRASTALRAAARAVKLAAAAPGTKDRAGAGGQLQEIHEPPQCNSLEVRNAGRAQALQQPHGQLRIAGVRGHSPIELAQIASRRRWSGYGPLLEAFQVGPCAPDRIIENRIHIASLRSEGSPDHDSQQPRSGIHTST